MRVLGDYRPPAFFLSPAIPTAEATATLALLLGQRAISNPEYDLLFAVLEAASSDPNGIAALPALTDALSIKRPTILRRIERMVTAGVIERHRIAIPGLRGRKVAFAIDLPRAVNELTADALEASLGAGALIDHPPQNSPQDELALTIGDTTGIEGLPAERRLPLKGEQLSVFTLVSALPSTEPRGRRRDEADECTIRVGHEWLQVTVRPQSGVGLARVLDTRVLVAVITLVHNRIHGQGLPARNPFRFQVEELAEVLRQAEPGTLTTEDGSYKNWIVQVLRRWEGTAFEIRHLTPKMNEFFEGGLTVEETFRFINKTSVLQWTGPKGKTPTHVALWLDEELLKRIAHRARKFLLTMPPEWMRERSAIALRLSLWCRRAIGRKHIHQTFGRRELHAEVDPKRESRYFYRDLRHLYRERLVPGQSYARLHSWLFEEINGGQHYRFWPDPDDKLVGVQSYGTLKQLESD